MFHSTTAAFCGLPLLLASAPGLSTRSPTTVGACPTCTRLVVPRATHSATTLRDGRVLIAGGMIRNGERLASAEVYDPRTRAFSLVVPMPSPRAGHTATLLRNGQILLAGGFGERGALATAVLYDPATARFLQAGEMHTPRGLPTATLLADGRVLIAGGENDDVATATAELYDPVTNRFTGTGSMGRARAYHVAALLPDGRVLVAGGGPDLGRVDASAEIYDPRSGHFSSTGSMLAARRKASATALVDGRILVAGGADTRDWRGVQAGAELYDPVAGRFFRTGSMTTARFKHSTSAVRLPDGRVLIVGGGPGADLFNPVSAEFVAANGTPTHAVYYPAADLLGDGSVLVSGGYGEDGEARPLAYVLRLPPVLTAPQTTSNNR
ncbi:MAG: hypothetical protein NVS4B3_06620 [Gemmatimonadaceae bacterium]